MLVQRREIGPERHSDAQGKGGQRDSGGRGTEGKAGGDGGSLGEEHMERGRQEERLPETERLRTGREREREQETEQHRERGADRDRKRQQSHETAQGARMGANSDGESDTPLEGDECTGMGGAGCWAAGSIPKAGGGGCRDRPELESQPHPLPAVWPSGGKELCFGSLHQ